MGPPDPEPPLTGSAPKPPRRRRRLRRGRGCLYRRGAIWWIAYRHRSVQKHETSRSTDRGVAERLLAERLDQIGAERLGLRAFAGAQEGRLSVVEMLDAALDAYCTTRNIAREQTAPSIRSRIKALGRFFGGMRAAVVTEETVDRYIAERRRDGLMPATINREIETLRHAFRLAVARKRLSAMPLMPRLKENNVRHGFFDVADFEALVARLPDHLKDFARFAYLTAWRKGEITSLLWADVDRDDGLVRLRPERSKNGHGRIVPIEGDLVGIIARRWSARTIERTDRVEIAPWVFHRNGRPIAEIRKTWRSACEAAGLPGRLFHDLRRTAVRNMVRAGVREGVAMAISGHRTRYIFDRYNITSETDLRDAMRRTTRHVHRRGEGRGNLGQPRRFAASAAPRSHTPDDDEQSTKETISNPAAV